jgi:hypothetical protein
MARYQDAIEWIAYNDDTDFMDDDEPIHISVTLHLVADLFGKNVDQAVKDLRKAIAKQDKEQS